MFLVLLFFFQVLSFIILSASHAKPQGYDLTPSGPSLALGGSSSGFVSGSRRASASEHRNDGGLSGTGGCKQGEVLHVDGTCVVPIITRNVFLYDAPKSIQQPGGTPPSLPPPKIDNNIIFVRLPEGGIGTEPVIVPPPRQESIIYVLNKNDGSGGQRVIEVTAPPPSNPEVYFVTYGEGESPTLPIGVDLETALSVATEAGGLPFKGASGSGDGFSGNAGNSVSRGGFGVARGDGGVNTGSEGSSSIESANGNDGGFDIDTTGSAGIEEFGGRDGFGGESSSYSDIGFHGTGFDSGSQAAIIGSDIQYSQSRDNHVYIPSNLYSEP